ncbi:MAG: response regulator receiver protein [Sulfurimonas sp. RIFCSPHIGHO2_12_FULL_36_9]|jgi:CheY-like chemotaxis protein|uniref:response regulator n=1 Tax=unclassified Sulfurimonas TaxID=2623549 RepID=UPI0008B22B8A|nr:MULTISPECIES: response regulator [unclassified Sulfurimonas]OHD97935.1 MAG: response regulator receiver protein [Sulfurimonas sp. RIFCSPHIGHO2_12_FULL_36_9]OHE01826.1 MAG: response regulator receiver protein [Sulfurimonas sp. RIFCSPLOWO2_12_36_12]OHE08508.1 MAG: response regulator receiver protein [Sulfurimonas sp. RIFCSPLOWO2_12_FULL_36_74]
MSNVDLVQLTHETKKLSVMVVEDEKVANELLSSTFKNFFSEVKSCFNGKEALEAYLKSAPDVVFVDIIMAEMDGIELSRKIREINPNQIIIVISASNDIDKISESIEVGVNSFIQKPIDTRKIIELLTSVVSMINKKKRIETKTFSISLPLDLYEVVNDNAKAESISKNAVIIRALRSFYE